MLKSTTVSVSFIDIELICPICEKAIPICKVKEVCFAGMYRGELLPVIRCRCDDCGSVNACTAKKSY